MDDLEGILVVSLEQAVAAPYASSRLADAGARVIKIERNEGDFARRYDNLVNGESAYFVWLNRGKQSLRLNVKDKEDAALLGKIIAEADIFIQNLAPGAVSRLGFDPAELRKKFPRLIICNISGYGESGPYADQKAYDLLVQCEAGLSEITGTKEGPARTGVSVCDIAAGMTAFQAILQALYAREKTGQGRNIEVSLFHALSDWMNVPFLQYMYGGKVPARTGLNHPTIAPYGAYKCADGSSLVFSIQNEREWANLCSDILDEPLLAEREEFNTNINRVENRVALDEIINWVFSKTDRDPLIEKMEKAGIAYGRLSTLEDLKNHPQNRYLEVITPNGPVTMLDAGWRSNDVPKRKPARVPAIGEHDKIIRKEFL
ncbi:MAG: CoA transferase [Rhizobiaceae bacterium]|nr:CoA transferase [Rhizobiaceae bacterium]